MRARDPRCVTTLLSARAAPSLGDEAKVVAWCRAADYVVSVHDARRRSAPAAALVGVTRLAPAFPWYRAMILARTTALALYDVLARNDADAFDRTLLRTESQLAPLRV